MRSLALSLALLLLTSCGFHLRGLYEAPNWLNPIAILIKDAAENLRKTIKEQLETYNIGVTEDISQANFLLIIEKDRFRQEVTNISSSTAPRQYLLIYDVQFSLVKSNGPTFLSSNHVVVTRQVTINNDRILGSNAEELLLKQEMRADAATQIINRLGQAKLYVIPSVTLNNHVN